MARIHPEAELAAILVEETRKPAHQCAKAAAELAALARQLARLYEREPSGESRSDPETRGRVNRLESKGRAIVRAAALAHYVSRCGFSAVLIDRFPFVPIGVELRTALLH